MIRQLLFEKLISLGFLLIGLIFFTVYLAILDVPKTTIVTFVVLFLVLVVGWLFISYIVMKRKSQQLQQLLTQLEQPYLIGELLPKPVSITEKQYFDMMRTVSHDAISTVERTKKEAILYKEFVEQWIHELKTPLTAMGLILSTDADIRKLKRELKRLDNLTDHVLHYARLQSIEKDKQFLQFQLAPLVNEAVKNQMDLLIAAKIQVLIEGDASVYSDQKALQFMMNQLLINSAKYCPQSKVTITISSDCIMYEDNGIGIPAHEIPRIFERGYTGTNGRTLGTSTGMGLYIVAKMCEELHIQLSVDSKVGQYTRFTIVFPNLTKM